MSRLGFVLLCLAVCVLTAAAVISHYHGMCMEMHMGWAVITTDGVYCGRRLNESFDDYRRLDELVEKELEREQLQVCLQAHPDEKWKCDPRFTPPPMDFGERGFTFTTGGGRGRFMSQG